MGMAKHNYVKIPAYRKWVMARDRVLEDLHVLAQLQSSDEMRNVLTHVLFLSKSFYSELKSGNPSAVDRYDHQVKDMLRMGALKLHQIVMRMRARAYTLAKGSEGEILAQLQPKKQHMSRVDRIDLLRIRSSQSMAGGETLQRINLYMDRLRRKIVSQAQSSALNAPDVEAFLIDVLQAFPKKKKFKRPPRALKPGLMEAADKPKVDIAIDAIDSEAWNDMLDAYKTEFVPNHRSPEHVVGIPTTEQDEWYMWEFERDMTNEFVQAVRTGQIEAAKENGIIDFVWIAVIDSVTDACCRWRDGLLVSEIEKQLSVHKDEDDECRLDNEGLTPPIHFNCRCTLAPATDEIPEKPDSGAKEFQEWLES